MMDRINLRANRTVWITAGMVALLLAFAAVNMRPAVLTSVLLSGLTLGALYFLVTVGLSLIFGLMDVLNFAHGVLFVVGAYIGYTLYQNPRTVVNVLPLGLALAAGMSVRLPGPKWRLSTALHRTAQVLVLALSVAAIVIALTDFPLSKLLAQAATATGGAVATAAAQTSDIDMLRRAALLFAAGLLASPLLPRRTATRGQLARAWGLAVGLAALAAGLISARFALEAILLSLTTDLRFALALVAGALTGALLGATMEFALIRPLYSRPVYQILLTLGLVFVGDELVKFVWGPSGYFMEIPSLFNGQGRECPSDNLLAWFSDHCSSILVMGRGFPSYRLFIIALGTLLLISIGLLLTRTRIGMIIRAGVQDAQMVEALGINVRRMFTAVFALGAGLAALGGVAAAPIIGVNPGIGQEFLLQAFIAVVIGGMGSLSGAALGALLVGLARAFGDNIVLSGIQLPWMAEAISASPAIARASTVLIMALVLLLKPSGLFGKRD